MGCAHKQNKGGFTLVEIAIVMIIIGLLIGGTFAGMRLVESSRQHRTIQQIKSIEAAALTFRMTYGRPPGDFAYPSQRLSNCTTLPCSRAGDGNRIVGTIGNLTLPANPTNTENYAFWHHLIASNLIDERISNTLDFAFGRGQPRLPLSPELGLRVGDFRSAVIPACVGVSKFTGATLVLTPNAAGTPFNAMAQAGMFRCSQIKNIDVALDDGMPYSGRFQNLASCASSGACNAGYVNPNSWTVGAYYGLR
jgi:prepilin-type N-terminal cleavage/methylation domain-containing protein